MNRAELIAYFMRALRSGRGPDTDDETLARSAAAMADAFLENRVERPGSERGEPFA
jgi:AcrR family transcriptional regulator